MTDNISKGARLRSPNFPYISLERAIELVRMLYKTYRRSLVRFDTAIATIELSPKSSKAKQIMAAVSAFGLIETEGAGDDKKIKISDLGNSIIIDDRSFSPERDEHLRAAALNPNIFRIVYEKFSHEIPPDEALGYELKVQHNFNPDSVADFIKVYKQTMGYAKVYESGVMPDKSTTSAEDQKLKKSYADDVFDTFFKPSRAGVVSPYGKEREIANYPVGRGLKARIIVSGDTPVSLEAIEKLIKLLELNKEDLSEKTSNETEN